jgi:hypothetical protein
VVDQPIKYVFPSLTERVVGYDVRKSDPEYWADSRKRQYLYRLDVGQPFSADTTAWPSLLPSGSPEAVGRFGFQDTWARLDVLRERTREHVLKGGLDRFHTIAITLHTGSYSENDVVNWRSMLPPTKPDKRLEEWSFLGHDVCDAWLLSALTNYGFNERDNVPALREEWAPRLNQVHLFHDIQDAIAFKKLSDGRLNKDHIPCFVFGIWIVR